MSVKKSDRFDRKEIVPMALVVLMFAAGFLLYHSMPERMPVHWNSEGKVDGYGSRFTGLLLIPIMTFVIYIAMSFVPYIAVYKKNIKAFYFFYFGFKLVFVLFMALLYMITLLPNFGIVINMNYLILPLIAVMIFFAGILMEKSKRNYFIGIRTPWTLSSDTVWEKTNRLGGRGFKIIAVLMIISMLAGKYAIIISVGALLLFVAYIYIYSYRVFTQEKNKL